MRKASNKANEKYSVEFKSELDRRIKAYEDGSEPAITSAESRMRMRKLLKAVPNR